MPRKPLILPRFLDATAAGIHLGKAAVLKACVDAAWIKPKLQRKKTTLYSLAELDACADRIESGEDPVLK